MKPFLEEMMSGRRSTLSNGKLFSKKDYSSMLGLGMDLEISAPQYTEVSFKYFHLDHPVRRLCIRILSSP